MDQTLVLNATYEPLRIVSWQKAMTLLFQGKVEVIAVYDREIRGVTVRVKLPSVLRLLRHVRMKRPFADVPFSRANIYARDAYRCQYCAKSFPTPELTFDHVVPVAQGGRKDWENIVTCCVSCNRTKATMSVEELRVYAALRVTCPCGVVFRPRWADWKRGYGRTHSRACAGRLGGRRAS